MSSPACPSFPPNLHGPLPISTDNLNIETIEAKYARYFKRGGFYTPSDCRAAQRLAIVIPFRDRDQQLVILLNHLLPILMRQKLEFKIYVIEQSQGDHNLNKHGHF